MKIVFSWDDGALEDQKLFELHEKYEIPGMFFVPTQNREGRAVLDPSMLQRAESKYISFGGHTENHAYLTSIPLENVEMEILKNKLYLEEILGHKVEDFCLPGGKYNQKIIEKVYKHFKTIRTADTMNFSYTGGLLQPSFQFYNRGYKSVVGNLMRHRNYYELCEIMRHPRDGYFEMIKRMIKYQSQKDESVIAIWGHSWELEEHCLWRELEDTFSYCKSNFKNEITEYRNIFEGIGKEKNENNAYLS